MDINLNVNEMIQKTRRYEFIDGLRELQMAVLFLSIGGFIWLTFEPPGIRLFLKSVLAMKNLFGVWANWLAPLLYVTILLLIVVGSLSVMRVIRDRWLWNESGWVKPHPWSVPRRVSVLSVVIFLAGIGLGIALLITGRVEVDFVLHMLWAATGWALGFTLIGLGYAIGLSRYIWLGAIGGLASTVVLFLPLTFGQTALLLYGAWALALGVTGGVALRRALPALPKGNHSG